MNHLESIMLQAREIRESFFDLATLKFLFGMFVVVFHFLFGDKVTFVGMLSVLIIIDFITGAWASRMCNECIESRKALKTATKAVMYGLFLASAHLTSQFIPYDIGINQVAYTWLAVTEFISILENFGKAGYSIPNALLGKLQNLQKKL